jgi:hypothetical protein
VAALVIEVVIAVVEEVAVLAAAAVVAEEDNTINRVMKYQKRGCSVTNSLFFYNRIPGGSSSL